MRDAKILLVDDRYENLLALEGVLRGEKRQIFKANSGQEALELLVAHHFAVALIDVQMPNMNGFELAELMRSSDDTQTIPIIFVTAGVRDQNITFKGFEAGAVDFLYKPLNEHFVRSKVNVFLDLDRQRRQLEHQVESLRIAQAKLERSQVELATSNRELERFAYIASHDMKEPLRVINTYLSLIDRSFGKELGADGREYISTAKNGAQRLFALIDSLIRYSKVGNTALELNPTNTNDLINEVKQDLSAMLQEKKVELTVMSLPTVKCDKTQIRQLFQNLLSNAVKFNDTSDVKVTISADRLPTEWLFSIEDNGIGVSEKDRAKIFDAFVRGSDSVRYPGSGLGLAACKTIVTKHSGRIWVEPNTPRGSKFLFTLPAE